MRKLISSTLLCCIIITTSFCQTDKKEIGNLVAEGIPEIPQALMERMNQYQNVRSASLSSWNPDGSGMLISTRFAETPQLHFIDHPGGARRQITFFKEPITSGSYCPDTNYKGFMFTKDLGGNEFAQLFWFDTNTGKYEMISDGGRSQNSLPTWSNKGNQFLMVSTRRNSKDYDLYLADMKSPKDAKLILQQGGSWAPIDWAPDDKHVLVLNYISANKSFLYILDVEMGKLEQINPSSEDISFGGALWSGDGKGLYMISDQGSEFQTLKYYDITTKKSTDISSSIHWDIDDITATKDRGKIVFTTNENGISKLYNLDPATKKFTPSLSAIPIGIISNIQFTPDGTALGLVINTSQSPGDIYSINLKDNKLTRWTYSEVGGLNNSSFTIPTLIEYETFDKVDGKVRKIPAFYYKSKNTSGKMPVVISIHGGPEAQFQPFFSSFNSFMTNELGIAVIAPNVRGSSGYGKTYLKLDNGFLREESVKDIGALLDWIARQPELDASRIAVYGGSYGGYMVLSSVFNYNAKIKCGIDVVGISNFVTFLKNTEDYRKDLRRVEYGDERDAKMNEYLTKISPANNVDKITKPLLIIQGQNDPRVPFTESEQMKQKLRNKGNTVWYLLGKDEGHGFRKKNNVDYMQWSIVLFLQQNLIN
ncbi:MAG TPA: prolyl oligopeptidase family serine peptidase [Cyclobacteriaceae bacterium]|nr:prolyl oligopeptidase family serine peptidase [Cyclobacteriaceae bacterium]